MSWICPNCKGKLKEQDTRFECVNGHNFDKAKQGYVNLLLAQHKNSLLPGDTAQMVKARRQFLAAGHFRYLVDTLAGVLADSVEPLILADLGCGEGYYSAELKASLNSSLSIYGVDISKEAVKKAAAKYNKAQFAVASAYDIPLANHSVDIALSIFAPFDEHEVKRILTSEGYFIRVTPGKSHLFELKSRLYDDVKMHREATMLGGCFDRKSLIHISEKIHLNSTEDIYSLLAMTPFFWSSSEEKKKRLIKEQSLDVQSDFVVELFYPIKGHLDKRA